MFLYGRSIGDERTNVISLSYSPCNITKEFTHHFTFDPSNPNDFSILAIPDKKKMQNEIYFLPPFQRDTSK